MIKFKINNFITLKLENGKTNIYVGNELFRQCKFLLLEIPVKEISSFDELESIDDASERLDKTLEKRKLEIPAETEFWGHCSNIQVWSEYEYDTRLLHRNLAFPLLKKLSDSGDSIAKRVFKEEVVKRLEKGNQNIIDFLIEGGYTRYLDDEELIFSILDPKEFKKLKELEQNYGVKLEITQKRGGNGIKLRNRHLVYLSLYDSNLKEIPNELEDFLFLKYLDLSNNEIENIPEFIKRLKNLKVLKLNKNKIQMINKSIGNLISLDTLELGDNKIKEIPKTINSLTKLKSLNLGLNDLMELPEEIGYLESLEYLNLNSNRISKLPESIGNLISLKELYIEYNVLQYLPDTISKLKSIKGLYFNHNLLSIIPEHINFLKSLKFLHLNKNKLEKIPDSVIDLPELQTLDLRNNKLKYIPKGLFKEGINVYT